MTTVADDHKLSIIVPVYNEEKNIPRLIERLNDTLRQLHCRNEIVFVMDPSNDATQEVILKFRQTDPNIKLIRMSRRFGQPACTLAGLHYCTGDAAVIIDADLQDPPELIQTMVDKWKQGYDVVYAQRVKRKGETFVKRAVSYLGYWVINKIAEVNIPRNTGDFRLISRRVIDHIRKLKEHDGFLRGLVAYVGFSQIAVPYERDARASGIGNYNRFLGSLNIALNGFLGFSKYPLHMIAILGFVISTLSFLLGVTYLVLKIISFEIKWGNPTLVILISFLSGIQLLSLGVIGEYFARIFNEIKGRPMFIVDEAHGFETGTRV